MLSNWVRFDRQKREASIAGNWKQIRLDSRLRKHGVSTPKAGKYAGMLQGRPGTGLTDVGWSKGPKV